MTAWLLIVVATAPAPKDCRRSAVSRAGAMANDITTAADHHMSHCKL